MSPLPNIQLNPNLLRKLSTQDVHCTIQRARTHIFIHVVSLVMLCHSRGS